MRAKNRMTRGRLLKRTFRRGWTNTVHPKGILLGDGKRNRHPGSSTRSAMHQGPFAIIAAVSPFSWKLDSATALFAV